MPRRRASRTRRRCRRPRADRTVDEVLAELQEHHQKYKYVEQEITARKRRLTFKQPEIRKCLDAVELLLEQSERGEEVRRPWACRLCRLPLPPPPPPTGPPSTCPTVHPDPSRTHPADTLLQTVLDFALSDQVYARARVRGAASVNLWLGAGVMLEYDLPEAKQLLVRRGTAAQRAARAACGARCGWRCVPAPGSCLCRRPGLR